MYGHRLAHWERITEWPMVIAALVFFAAYATEILDSRDRATVTWAEVVIWATWVLFAVDYAVRLVLAQHRWRWFYRHLADLLVVALPMFRPLRLMRFLTVIAFVSRSAGGILRGRAIIFTVGAAALTIVIAALAILDAEAGRGGIDTFGQALWWSFQTMATVGYGDYVPVTVEGRIVAAGVMVGGIALLGSVTATLSSWIIEQVSAETVQAERVTRAQVEGLRREIAAVRALLEERRERDGIAGAGPDGTSQPGGEG